MGSKTRSRKPKANSLLRVLCSDLRRLQSESQDAQVVRNMFEQQLSEKEVNFPALQVNLGKEQQTRKYWKILRRNCFNLEEPARS